MDALIPVLLVTVLAGCSVSKENLHQADDGNLSVQCNVVAVGCESLEVIGGTGLVLDRGHQKGKRRAETDLERIKGVVK